MSDSTSNNMEFWEQAAKEIDWFTPFTSVLDDSRAPVYHWFPNATCNTSYNSLDRHVANGRGEQAAIIYDSPVTNTIQHFSYAELLGRVSRFAGALRQLGVEKGDRVVIYMPMVPEAAVAMQACARLGAIHSVVFGGFASNELASRIDDCEPKLIISASCGIEPSGLIPYKPLLDKALELCDHQVQNTVIFQREQLAAEMVEGRDLDWHTVEAGGEETDCVPVAATDPLYIIYTSGTTGQPKGVVRDNGGHMVALNWSMGAIYGIDPGDVFFGASDIGWVVGHSYIVYGPLIRGATAIMFEGKPVGTPDYSTYWRMIEQHKVKAMFTAPTAIRAIKQQDPEGKGLEGYDLSALKTLFLAGERADTDTIHGILAQEEFCDKASEPSWLVSLDYRINEENMVYLTSRTSWRTGGYNNTSINVTDAGLVPDSFKLEEAMDVEAGWKFSGAIGEVPARINLAVYKQVIDDVQRTVYLDVTSVTGNVEEAEVKGIEIDAQFDLTDWLEVGAAFAYTDAEYTKPFGDVAGYDFAFGPYADAPENTYSIYFRTETEIEGIGLLSFRGDFYHSDDTYFSNLNDSIGPGTELPEYDLANFRLALDDIAGSSLSANIYVRNAFDEEYVRGGLPLAGVHASNATIAGEPRTFGAEVSYRF